MPVMRFACLLLLLFPLAFFSEGQLLEVREVRQLPAGINSQYEESTPMLAPDGKTLYFTRVMHPENVGGLYGGSDVWTSRLDPLSGIWGKGGNKNPDINTKGNNTLSGINVKGDAIYLLNTWGINFTKKTGDAWHKPELIRIPDFKAAGFIGAYVAPEYDVIILSMEGRDTHGAEDLYVCLKDGRGNWSSPRNLGSAINTNGFEIAPFLSPDKKRLYFSSNAHPGEGDADIFFSNRLYDSWDIWSAPVNLGNQINSPGFDAYFSIYGDSLAFFASNRDKGMSDIYQAKIKVNDHPDEVVKKYLAPAETRELVGAAPMEVKFERTNASLNTAQNELLFYVVNKIITLPEIKIQLVTNEGQADLTTARLEAVSEKLKLLGLSSYRIDLLTVKEKASPDGIVKIVFFR